MRILFFGRRFTYFRNFDTVLRELASRGHVIHLAVERETEDGRRLVDGLVAEYPDNITVGVAPGRADDDWSWLTTRLRPGLEHLRYQHKLFDDTPMLRQRSRERTPGLFVTVGDAVGRYARWARRPIEAVLRWLERATPDDAEIRAYVEAQRPDLVLITPLIALGSSQIDYLRAARSLGIPTALCVWSWDHLSSKALIRELPDRVFVWNDTQKREAQTLHRITAGRIVVTGAQCFDKWFDRAPSRDRKTFCRQIGLPADRPILLYVCSAPFSGSPPEAPFVVDWIRRIRTSPAARLRNTPILIRPHPSRRPEWEGIDLTPFADVVLWGSDPLDASARADYFDSLYHSAVVAGLNTSAFIEAGILGRPVHTILLPEWYESQMGTVHFRYLFEAGGGLLTSATSYDEHLAQLDQALAQPSTEIRPFIREFVRPRGLEVAATPVFVEQVEAMKGLAVAPLAEPRWKRLALWMLNKGISWRHDLSREHLLYSERELEKIGRMRTFHQTKAARERDKRERDRAIKAEKAAAHERAKRERELAIKAMKAAAKEQRRT
ncbi:MAG TPA: hypothetical protein VKA59_06850 [Vicinamibacterales bacterium]|nr:hypothetical protein [Vicinamibacterales bacterium]